MIANEWMVLLFFTALLCAAFDITRRALKSITAARLERDQRRAMRKMRASNQPWVTVLVYGKNQGQLLEKTLRSVCRSRYTAFDVVAISDRSHDDTRARVMAFCAASTHTVKSLNRRAEGALGDSFRAGYRKSHKGGIVLLLQAGDIVDPLLIKRTAIQLYSKNIWSVAVQREYIYDGLRGAAERLQDMMWPSVKTVQACDAKTLRTLFPHKSRKVRLIWPALFWCLWVVALVAVACIEPATLWYIWVVFSLYSALVVVLHSGTARTAGALDIFAVPSMLFLLPIASLATIIVPSAKK